MGIIKRLNKCTACSFVSGWALGGTWKLRHSPCHEETHRLSGRKDSENIFTEKNMVNAILGLSMGAVGMDPEGPQGRAGKASGNDDG